MKYAVRMCPGLPGRVQSALGLLRTTGRRGKYRKILRKISTDNWKRSVSSSNGFESRPVGRLSSIIGVDSDLHSNNPEEILVGDRVIVEDLAAGDAAGRVRKWSALYGGKEKLIRRAFVELQLLTIQEASPSPTRRKFAVVCRARLMVYTRRGRRF